MGKRPAEAIVKRVDQLEDNPIMRGKGKPRKAIGEAIKKELDLNGLSIDMVYNRIV